MDSKNFGFRISDFVSSKIEVALHKIRNPKSQIRIRSVLPFRELEPFPRALLTVFLSFLDARVARDQPCMLEGWAQISIVLEKRASDAVTNRASLSSRTTARHINKQIELVRCLRQLQWLTNDHAQCFVWKIAVKRFPVNLNFAGTRS